MALLEDLVDRVEGDMLGYTIRRESMGTLAAPIAASGSLSLTVEENDLLTRGPIQVDDELLVVTAFDGKTATIPAWGRGYAGSTPAAHAAGSRVTVAPVFPRYKIRDAIVSTVDDFYPDLFGVGKATITLAGAVRTYALPAETEKILGVRYDTTGPSGSWRQIKSWAFNPTANLDEYPTGRAITLPADRFTPGQTVDITLMTKPAIGETEDSWDDLFLFPSAAEATMWGTKYRLVSSVDFGLIDAQSISAGMAQRPDNRTNPSDLARQLYALYRDAVDRERSRMLASFQSTIHFVG